MWYTKINLKIINFHFIFLASCDTITTLGTKWTEGQDGTFNLIVPAATTTSWTIVATFDMTLTELKVYEAVVTPCAGSSECTFANKVCI